MHFMQRANKHANAYGKTIHKVIIAALHAHSYKQNPKQNSASDLCPVSSPGATSS